VVQQEERLVAAIVDLGDANRTVDLHTVLVEIMAVLGSAHAYSIGERHTTGLVLEGIGVEPAAAGKFIDGPVEAIATALQRNVNAACAAILGVVSIGLDLEFLDCIHRRYEGDIVAARLGI